jgi:transcriptional regulator with XRE-family HTH domain
MLAPLLRAECQRRGWSPRDLALRAGVDPATLGRLERGRGRRPSPRTLEKLAAPLGLPLDALARAAANDAAAEEGRDA